MGERPGADLNPDTPSDQAGTIIQPARFPGRAAIEAYGNGGFRFADMSHVGSILALPDGIEAWPPNAVAAIDAHTLAPLLQRAATIDVLLIGTGPSHEMLNAEARQTLADASLAFEIMSTGAAVRTYNVLLSEDRAVAAALIAVGDSQRPD